MLILQRKEGESLLIGDEIEISILSVEAGRVRLAISAPQDVPILRSELVDATAANRDSAAGETAPAELLDLFGSSPEHSRQTPPAAKTPRKEV